MAIQTSAGTTLGMSTTLPTTFDDDGTNGYPSLTYTTIGEITEIPAFGSVYNLITHNPLGERRVTKRKGSINDGTLTLTFAADAADTGQAAIKTAHTSDSEIAIKITYPDGEDDFFTALVMSYQINAGGSDSIKQDTVTLELTRAPVNVAA